MTFLGTVNSILGRDENDIDNDKMDAIKLLILQHKEVDALFEEFESAGERPSAKKFKIFSVIAEKLKMHAHIEEVIFYPAIKKIDESLVLESYEEHDVVKNLIAKGQKNGAADKSFIAIVTVLKEVVRHHVKEEENDLFPECKSRLKSDTLELLGKKMQVEAERFEKSKSKKQNQKKSKIKTNSRLAKSKPSPRRSK